MAASSRVRFYCFEVVSFPQYENLNNCVLLVGKTNTKNEPAFLLIEDVPLSVYFLSTNENEVKKVLSKHSILEYQLKQKPNKRFLAHSCGSCQTKDLIKVTYKRTNNALISTLDLPILQTDVSVVETFLLKKFKRGNGWLEFQPNSECSFDFKSSIALSSRKLYVVKSIRDVSPLKESLPTPSIKILILADSTRDGIQTTMVHHRGMKVPTTFDPKEQANMTKFISKYDPDIIVVHNLPALLISCPSLSQILKDVSLCRSKINNNQFAQGRMLWDNAKIIRELTGSKEKLYSLQYLADFHLPSKYKALHPVLSISELFTHFNILKHLNTLSFIVGIPLARTSGYNTLDKNDWLLLHQFKESKCIPPPPINGKRTDLFSFVFPKNNGGLFLETAPGLHEDGITIELDYRSLYPSLILEKSICWDEAICDLLPPVVERLIQMRIRWKEMKLPPAQIQALKLLTNTIYGKFDDQYRRFFNPYFSASITTTGRELLKESKEVALRTMTEELKPVILFGATDSLFINVFTTDLPLVHQYIAQVIEETCKNKKAVKLECQTIFSKVVFFSQKNRYVAFSHSYHSNLVQEDLKTHTLVYKGVDQIKRDCSHIIKTILDRCVMDVLFGTPRSEEEFIVYCREMVEKMRKRDPSISLQEYLIIRELSRTPEDYIRGAASTKTKVLPYVKLVPPKSLPGTRVSFIMSFDDIPLLLEMMEDDCSQVNVEWYITKQLVAYGLRLVESERYKKSQEYFNSLGGKKVSVSTPTAKRNAITQLFQESRRDVVIDKLSYLQKRRPLTVACPKCSSECLFLGLLELEKLILMQPSPHTEASMTIFKDGLFNFFTRDGIFCPSCHNTTTFNTDLTITPLHSSELSKIAIYLNFDWIMVLSLANSLAERGIIDGYFEKYNLKEKFNNIFQQ